MQVSTDGQTMPSGPNMPSKPNKPNKRRESRRTPPAAAATAGRLIRRRLPRSRRALTRRLEVQTTAGALVVYVTTGYYGDGKIGELFARGRLESTDGSVQACWTWLRPALDAWTKAVSRAIQYGADPEVVLRAEVGTHCGMTEGSVREKDGGETHWSTSVWSLVAEWTLKRLAIGQEEKEDNT